MPHGTVRCVVLMLGIVVVSSASAQVSRIDDAQDSDQGIRVRRVSDIGTLERLNIALTRALVIGAKVFAPLYAYSHELACVDGSDPDLASVLDHHVGSAAIVDVGDTGVAHAFYYKNVQEAIASVADRCEEPIDGTWYLATTYPLNGGIEEEERYLSREVERIAARLQQQD